MSVAQQNNPSRDGAALIVALMVVGLLAVVVSAFAFDMHVEARVTSYHKKALSAEFLSQAGVEKAVMLLAKSSILKEEDADEDDQSEFSDKFWFLNAKALADGGAITDESALGDGLVRVTISPEPARRNINRLQEDDWERVLEVAGVDEALWDELIDCVLDWIDKDSTPRTNGAESEDYYETLDNPYTARNGPMDTIDELLLVKGFTQEIFDGIAAAEGEVGPVVTPLATFEEMLTVYGDGRVNVNAAPMHVLMTLPGIDDFMADEILTERDGEYLPEEERGETDTLFENVGDFNSRFPDIAGALRGRITTDSQIFRIESVGQVGKVTRSLSCIVNYSKEKLTILRWMEPGTMTKKDA